jgi:hypothetical protein
MAFNSFYKTVASKNNFDFDPKKTKTAQLIKLPHHI